MAALANAHAVLRAALPQKKTQFAFELAEAWAKENKIGAPIQSIEDRPARPDNPQLISPREIPRRGLGHVEGRIALLHAVAHIEFNAIDLAADMICRFASDPLIGPAKQVEFISDWIGVCADEARHFNLIHDRLQELDAHYGDQPAHDGLWEAALSTRHDLAARLAIAPMVLEARGLDVTPAMITKLENVNDTKSADILRIIYNDEIGHVACGTKWFTFLCAKMGATPEVLFAKLVKMHFSGSLKPPFNAKARTFAGLTPSFYTPLV